MGHARGPVHSPPAGLASMPGTALGSSGSTPRGIMEPQWSSRVLSGNFGPDAAVFGSSQVQLCSLLSAFELAPMPGTALASRGRALQGIMEPHSCSCMSSITLLSLLGV